MASNNPRSRDPTAAITTKKKECYVFEPQQWRRSVCKNCFRSLHDHPTEPTAGGGNNGKGLSPRTSPLLGSKSISGTSTATASSTTISKDPVVLRKGENSPTSRRRPKSDEFKQKTPSPRESKRSLTSGGRRSPANSPSSSCTRHSGSFTAQNRQSSTSSIDVKYVEELENDFFDLEDKYDGLCKEKCELEADLSDRNRTIEELQEDVESYKLKILHLERRIQHLDEEIRSYRERLRLPESDQANLDVSDAMNSKHQELLGENEQLRLRLEEIEQLCQEVMEENEVLKEEQEEMQREIEEMHDHFQEDDTDTLRELKRDLETSNKNCRIFQFKLRKTERRYEQCENERAVLEDKLNRLESQLYSENDVNLIRGLEEELRVAKEVSVRLNSELELVDEKRSYFEEDNKHLKEDLQDSEKRRKMLEGELSKCRQEIEKLKSIDTGGLTIPENQSMRKTRTLESMSREPSFEEQSLQRELDAAKERETDLNEQLKFSEDEIRKLKRRLNDADEENDSLSKKLETIMSNKSIDENDYEDVSIQTMKVQMELLEKENITLRKKMVITDKENANLLNETRQLKAKNNQGSEKNSSDSDERQKQLEAKIVELNSDIDRMEKENRKLTVLNSLNQSAAGSKQKSPPALFHLETDLIQNSQNQELKAECKKLKEQIKQYDKQVKVIMSQVEQHYGSEGDDKKQLDILKKYNEVTSSFREQQKEILQIRKQMDAMNTECQRYKDFYDKNAKNESKKKSDTKSDLENASKAVLLDEIMCLEEEIDELASKHEKAEFRISILTKTISEKENMIDDLITENDKNEKELNQYIQNMLTKNTLLSDLLSCVETRANDLQTQFDRMASGEESGDGSSTTTTATTETGSVGGYLPATTGTKNTIVSAGSDDVFNEATAYQLDTPGNLNDVEKIKFRFSCLERLLSEERKRTRIAEKQAEMALKDSAHSRVNEDSQLKKKEIEMLKADLEEKNEMLEEKEQNIEDIKTRLEQTRKMNEALRTLLDKQDEGQSSSGSQRSRDGKEQSIELNSYKKEAASMKNEIHQYVIKINESEKIREKLSKEIRNLQAEMKVREEQIYEQDDEMRAKDQELRNVKKLLEETQASVKNQSQVTSDPNEIREKTLMIERLTMEMEGLCKSVQEYKLQNEEIELELRQNESQQKMLSDSVRTRDERIKEKDDLISHINQRLQHREKELADFDLIIQETNEKLQKNEEIIKEIQLQLSKKEIEFESLKVKHDELQTSNDNILGHLNSVKKENEKFKSRIAELEKEKTKPPMVPRISTTPSVDVDKLKNEIAQLKKDKESLIGKLNKDKGTFSAMRRDSDTAKSDSEAYTKAIQQQQYVTRVTLLTDNVTRLNRVNIDLKLQNEAIQNDMLEYQRRYKNIKEQYEAEQETWISERITLESRMKEYEDRKSVIASVRKALQDASLKVATLEAKGSKERQENEQKLTDLENAKSDLQKKLSQYEEKEKLPKVFQRFGGKMSSRTANDIVQDKEKTELKVKLDAAEKLIQKLRSEIVEKEESFSEKKIELLKKSEETRIHLNDLVQNLSDKLAEMEGCKEQLFLLRERIYTLEEAQERDRKIWSEERMVFQFRLEDSRMMIESWLEKIIEAEHSEELFKQDMIVNLEKEVEKYLYSKECIPYAHMRRREDEYSLDMIFTTNGMQLPVSQQDSAIGSVPSSPASTTFGKSPMKSISLDWTNRMTKSQFTPDLSGSNQSINISPFMRNNRSVSPDQAKTSITTRKLTNYPDPTPGFLLKPSSRQSSSESVSKDSDYTQRSFTLPGMRNNRSASRISPARQKFFDTSTESQPTNINESPQKPDVPLVIDESKPKPAPFKVFDQPPPSETKNESKDLTSSKTLENIVPKSGIDSKISKPTEVSVSSQNLSSKSDLPEVKSTKSKSTSIAPSIQQLRMKFAQKSTSTSSFDSSTLKK